MWCSVRAYERANFFACRLSAIQGKRCEDRPLPNLTVRPLLSLSFSLAVGQSSSVWRVCFLQAPTALSVIDI